MIKHFKIYEKSLFFFLSLSSLFLIFSLILSKEKINDLKKNGRNKTEDKCQVYTIIIEYMRNKCNKKWLITSMPIDNNYNLKWIC